MGIRELNDIRQMANFYLSEYLNIIAESERITLYEFRAKLETIEEIREAVNYSIDKMIEEEGEYE